MGSQTWLGYEPYDVTVSISTLAVVVFAVCSLVQVYRSRAIVANPVLWAFVIVVFPLLGSLLWFVWGRPTITRTGQPSSTNERKTNAP